MNQEREQLRVLQERIYDDLRRRVSPGSNTLSPVDPKDLGLDLRRPEDADAFFSAIRDLESEGYLSIDQGSIVPIARPKASLRTQSFFEEHRVRGAAPKERMLGAGLFLGQPAAVRDDFPDLAAALESDRSYTFYQRVQIVDEEPWALTISAFPFPLQAFAELSTRDEAVDLDVFDILRDLGAAPTRRRELLSARFPYRREAASLDLTFLSRVPVIAALGFVYAADRLVEHYLCVMRADRYVIPVESTIDRRG